MKRTSKLILVALCIVLVMTSFLFLVACDKEKPTEPAQYSVTTQYNAEQGAVTVSAPASGEKYAEGEQVTVTVTPKQNFKVATFSVSGHSDAKLDANGKYVFTISADTTITVTFAEDTSTKPEPTVNVTVKAGEGAHVTLNPQPQNGKLKKDTSVTITVSIDDGYLLDKVIVGKEVQLVDNKYTFVVTEDVTIEVTTSLTPLLQALRALQGDVKFEGTMVANYDGEKTNATLITIYDSAQSAVWQRELSDDYTMDMVWGKCNDGSLGFYIHDFTTGYAELIPYTDYNGYTVPFEQSENVFNKLTLADFASAGDNVWKVVDSDVANAIALSITGYDIDVESLQITLSKKGVQLSILSKDMEFDDGSDDTITVSFAFELSVTDEDATIPMEYFTDYLYNAELELALENAAKATSYTAKLTSKDLLNDDAISSFNTYVSNGVMWMEDPDDMDNRDVTFGYLTRPDGKIWEFFVDFDYNDRMWLGIDPIANSLLAVSSNFDLGGIHPSMFVKNEDGKYVLRERDIIMYSNLGLSLPSMAAQALANGNQQYNDASEAMTFAITLKDGALYKVEYYCEYGYDNMVFRSHEDTVIFSNFNSTKLPDYVYIDADAVQGIISADYIGRWVDDDNAVQLDITLDGIVLEYEEAYDIVALPDGGYKFSCYYGDFTIVRQGDKLILEDSSGEQLEMHIKLSDWDELLGTFSLIAYLGGEDYFIVGVEIGVDQVVVYLGTTAMPSWRCYINSNGLLAVWTDYYDFFIWQADVDGNAIYLNFWDDDDNEMLLILYREDVLYDLTGFQGTFVSDQATVKIEGNDISVWLDGLTGVNVATDIHVNYYMQNNGNLFAEICFKIEGYVFYIQVLSEDKLVMYDMLDDWGEFLLVREGYEVDYSEYYGDYSAIDDEDNTLHIEDGKIIIVIDGVRYEFTDIEFYDVEFGLPAFWLYNDDGDLYYLQQIGYIPGYFILYDEWYNLGIKFVKDGFVPDTSYIDGNYFGYYDDQEYVVEIANGTIKVYIDGEEQAVSQIIYNKYDNYNGGTFYMLSFVMNGQGYAVQPSWEENGKIIELYFAEIEADEELFLLYRDQEEELDDWSEFNGVYEGDGYYVVIDDSGISIKFNNATQNVTELHFFSNYDYNSWSKYYEFRFNCNGASYVMRPADQGNCMLLVPVSGRATYVLIIEGYELDEYYGYYEDYYESDYAAYDHFYVIDVLDDDILIYIDGELCDTTVLYYGPDGGFVLQIDGKIYHLVLVWDDAWTLILFDNADLYVLLPATTKPNDDWSDYYGIYEGTDDEDVTYTIEIDDDGIFNVSVNGEAKEVTNVTMRYDREIDWDVFTFYMDGKRFTMIMYWDHTAYLREAGKEDGIDMDMIGGILWRNYLGYWECEEDGIVYGLLFTEDDVILTVDGVKQDIEFNYDSSTNDFIITWKGKDFDLVYGGTKINFYYYEDGECVLDIYLRRKAEGCEWKDALGTYANDNGTVTIYEDKIVIEIGSLSITVYAKDFTYSLRSGDEDYHRFTFSIGSLDYKIDVYHESGSLVINDNEDLYEIMHKQASSDNCAWEEFNGTWYAEDEYEYTFEISAAGIHATYADIEFTISAANITFIPGEGFYWIYDGVEYMLEISDDRLYFADVDYESEYQVYLEKVQSGDPEGPGEDPDDPGEEPEEPGDCAWEELIGTWYAEDWCEYTFEISAKGLHANYDGHDYTILAKDLTFIPGEGLYWIYDGVKYKIVLEDDSWYFADYEEDTDYWTYLEQIDADEPELPGGGEDQPGEEPEEPGECAWADYIGTWYAEDEYEYTFEISASGIHATYGDIEYTILAEDLHFEDGVGFTFTYEGIEYILEGSGEWMDFYSEEDSTYGASLEKIA